MFLPEKIPVGVDLFLCLFGIGYLCQLDNRGIQIGVHR